MHTRPSHHRLPTVAQCSLMDRGWPTRQQLQCCHGLTRHGMRAALHHSRTCIPSQVLQPRARALLQHYLLQLIPSCARLVSAALDPVFIFQRLQLDDHSIAHINEWRHGYTSSIIQRDHTEV